VREQQLSQRGRKSQPENDSHHHGYSPLGGFIALAFSRPNLGSKSAF
jgi:hypothetical protein